MPPTLRLPGRHFSQLTLTLPRISPLTVRSTAQFRSYAQESYGSSSNKEHDPANSDKSSKATQDREHPGPPPPDTSSSSSPKDSAPGESSPKIPSNKARPMIHDDRHQPAESEDAKKHNEEFEKRYEQASSGLNEDGEKVEKGFQKG